MEEKKLHALRRAIEILGNQRLLAEAIGVTQSAVSQMLRAGQATPAAVPKITRATKGMVTYHDLRPDLYDVPPPSRRKK